jgi:hypothetical protein
LGAECHYPSANAITHWGLQIKFNSSKSPSVLEVDFFKVFHELKVFLFKNSFVFTLQDATEQIPAGKGYASYDTTTSVLTIPAIKVGTATYLDVKLLNTGNFVFIIQGMTQLTASTVSEINALLASADALSARSVPASGAIFTSLADACYRNGGSTKAYNISDYDANLALVLARDAYRIGAKRTNMQVLAVRNSTNSNGSSRREIDVQYDLVYSDGSAT